MLSDYAFFGKAFHWPPDGIEKLTWSHRKRLKQAYMDYMAQNGNS